MATIDSSTLLGLLPSIRDNPCSVQQLMLNMAESGSNGERRYIDPTNPAVMIMEATAVLATSISSQLETLNRRQYPASANTTDDLFRHMSDRDYKDVFSSPAYGTLYFIMPVDEIRKIAVPISNNSNIRKVVIPKHSRITVSGLSFSMQYPVEIIVLGHGGITVQYDTSGSSPVYDASDFPIDIRVASTNGRQYIRVGVPMPQLDITSREASLNASTVYNQTFAFSDLFYMARVYVKNDPDNVWTEIATTHNSYIYDPNKATACLRVLNSSLQVTIPQIYYANGLLRDKVRIDIYTTKGVVNINLSNYKGSAFSAIWRDLDNVGTSVFSAPLNTFSDIGIASTETISGGSVGMTFAEIRQRMINNGNAGYERPITPDQLQNNVSVAGFDLVTNIDNVTDRAFLATKALPLPTVRLSDTTVGGTGQELQASQARTSVTGIGVNTKLFQTSMTEIALNSNVKIHGSRVTILPDALFTETDDVIDMVPDATVTELKQLAQDAPDALANRINNSNYFYTPFFYVLDISTSTFGSRAYHLDSPSINAVYPFQQNLESGINGTITEYEIITLADRSGYRLAVKFVGGSVFKAMDVDKLHVQLTMKDSGTGSLITFNGTLVSTLNSSTNKPIDGTYTYHFDITTDYDVDKSDNLVLMPFRIGVPLASEFNIVVIAEDFMPMGATYSDIDTVIDVSVLDNYSPGKTYLGVIQEKIEIVFGYSLDSLWTRSRSVVDSAMYQTYTEDVPAVYDQNIYDRNSSGQIIFILDASDGIQKPVILKRKGDPVLDSDGNPVYAHRAGDVVFDSSGRPVIAGGDRNILREFDIMLFDGKYYFANSDLIKSYLDEVLNTIVSWVTIDIPTIGRRIVDRSKVYYYPKTTIGKMEIIDDNGDIIRTSADLSMVVTYYVSEGRENDVQLIKYLTDYTPQAITAALNSRTIARSDIIDALKVAMGTDILAVEISGFDYPIISLTNTSMLPCIGKRLTVLSNLTFNIEDNVTVNVVGHKQGA